MPKPSSFGRGAGIGAACASLEIACTVVAGINRAFMPTEVARAVAQAHDLLVGCKQAMWELADKEGKRHG